VSAGRLRSRVRVCLNRRGARWLLAILESALVSAQRREVFILRPWKGWWVHRYATGTFVHANPASLPPEQFEVVTRDLLFHEYTPRPGDTVVDVGAGIGEELLTLSRLVGSSGRIVCVEAHPTTFERLLATIELNRLTNCEAVNLAIADRAGKARISDRPRGSWASNTLIAPTRPIAVPAETLDGLYRRFGLEHVDLMKMNIEGAEGLAIPGWGEALRRTRHVAVSCHDFLLADGAPSEVATLDAVRSAVEAAGFAVRTRPGEPRPWKRCYVYGGR
jgi:FkbM family methyltransferase